MVCRGMTKNAVTQHSNDNDTWQTLAAATARVLLKQSNDESGGYARQGASDDSEKHEADRLTEPRLLTTKLSRKAV